MALLVAHRARLCSLDNHDRVKRIAGLRIIYISIHPKGYLVRPGCGKENQRHDEDDRADQLHMLGHLADRGTVPAGVPIVFRDSSLSMSFG